MGLVLLPYEATAKIMATIAIAANVTATFAFDSMADAP